MAGTAVFERLWSNRFIQPFQVRDESNRTLLHRARWLLVASLGAVILGLLLSNRHINLLINRDYLEQISNEFVTSFYPTYDSLYYWLAYHGNMAQTVDERVHDENSAREFVRTWRADIATLADVKYFQFGSVSTHGQWRVEPGEDGWQVAPLR